MAVSVSPPGPTQDVRPVRRALISVFDKTGLEDLVRGLHEAGVALVSTGFVVAITTQSAANLRLPGVVFRPLKSQTLKELELSCLYRSGDSSPVLKAFLEVVHDFVGDTRNRPRTVRPA